MTQTRILMDSTPIILDSLCTVINEGRRGQGDLLMTIELIESRPWSQPSQKSGEAICRLETGLDKLYVRLGQILRQAEQALSALAKDGMPEEVPVDED
jgi:hypothetical protein